MDPYQVNFFISSLIVPKGMFCSTFSVKKEIKVIYIDFHFQIDCPKTSLFYQKLFKLNEKAQQKLTS